MKTDLCSVRAYLLLVFLLFFSNPIFALVVPGGTILEDTTWSLADSPIMVTGDVVFNNAAAALTIEAGVSVQFSDNTGLTIANGALVARGTSTDKITFTSNTPAGSWRNIKFDTGAVDATYDAMTDEYVSGSILEHVVIEKAGNQTNLNTKGVIQIFDAYPFMSNLSVQGNGASGVYAESVSSKIIIVNSNISENSDSFNEGGAGIYLEGLPGSEAIIDGNIIQNNDSQSSGGGIKISNIDILDLINNKISGNQTGGDGGGVYIFGLQSTGQNFLRDNEIFNNVALVGGGGFWIGNAGTTLTITNNKIYENDAVEGGGLFFENDPTSQIQILKNLISRNHSEDNGGGAHIFSGTHTLSENIYYMNTSGTHAGGMDIHGGADLQNGLSSLSNNIFANNTSPVQVLNLPGVGVFSNNSVIFNSITEVSGNQEGIAFQDLPTATGNLFAVNDVDSKFLIRFQDGDAVTSPNFTGNNFIGNTSGFLLANGMLVDVVATNNWWNTVDQTEIDAMKIGPVDVTLPSQEALTNVPLMPPNVVSVSSGTSDITVNWDANIESDVAGYIVYWGTESAPNYTNSQSVGNVNTFKIESLSPGTYFVAVTATDGSGPTDDPITFINEKQTAGNESWYSQEKQITLLDTDLMLEVTASETSVRVGESISFTLIVTNNGPNAANNVTVTADIPVGVTLTGLPDGCIENIETITCSVTGLESTSPGNTVSFEIMLNAPGTEGILTLEANVTADEFDSNMGNNNVSINATVNVAEQVKKKGGGGLLSAWLIVLITLLVVIRKNLFLRTLF